MCGPMKIPKLRPAPGNRTRDFKIARTTLHLTATDTTIRHYRALTPPLLLELGSCSRVLYVNLCIHVAFVCIVYIENTYIVLPIIKKCLTRLGELVTFEPWRENYHFSQPSQIQVYGNTIDVFYLSLSDLLSCINSNTDKYEFISIWNKLAVCNDVINHVDNVIKPDVYPQKMYSCSKDIRGFSFFVLKISVVYRKKCHGYCVVER